MSNIAEQVKEAAQVAPLRPLGKRQAEQDLSGKIAIVTGASRGIGRQAALALARRGANVAIAARTVHAGGGVAGTIGGALAEIEALGAEAIAVATDLSQEDDLQRLVQSTVDRFGGVDILVNNAAVTIGHSWAVPIAEMPRQIGFTTSRSICTPRLPWCSWWCRSWNSVGAAEF